MVIISHPTANANVRAAAEGFLEANLLYEFHTSLALFPDSLLDRISNLRPFKELGRRKFDARLGPYTKMEPWFEIGRQIAPKFGLSHLTSHNAGILNIDNVYKNLDKKVTRNLNRASLRGASAIYSYEDGSLFSFQKSRSLGLKNFYDLPIGYWRAAFNILKDEQLKWPEWESTLINFRDSKEKLERKDKELGLADVIFVASSFTANTLKDYPGKLGPVEIIPYGFPKPSMNPQHSVVEEAPLKLLFVGGLSQRKGIANMFAAVESFNSHVKLTVVGQKTSNNCKALDIELRKHHWIPSLPHKDILNLMRENDVLLFPSLFEGFGLVITEAMSQGTPVITTNRTAGPDLIRHGENGWLVEPGSTIALKECIEQLLINRKNVAKAGKAALETAHSRSWKVYGRELAEATSKYLN
ncbi:glycosyltransferase family 4 protein [Salegentibacter sp. F188]|uniref:Glycosyltransferase family 4 protein n=1 Tax=Autumnicola patrickiae TaxID=3075591 RepID=A0ABU3DYM8_9FLAO|nr:glycosyltransferase family 4 protein [Salegentibacter sp. F188]MDT0688833.1 glycosyltransferase family 4 protein [Salegentibacter sp. F188]